MKSVLDGVHGSVLLLTRRIPLKVSDYNIGIGFHTGRCIVFSLLNFFRKSKLAGDVSSVNPVPLLVRVNLYE